MILAQFTLGKQFPSHSNTSKQSLDIGAFAILDTTDQILT